MQMITWTELMVVIAIGTIAWYGYVLLRYYRHVFNARRSSIQPAVKWVRETTPPAAPADVHAQVHELMQELKEVFNASVKEQLNKTQVLEAISHRLEKYNDLPGQIKASITQHLLNEFSLQLNMTVTQEQINALW